MEENTEIRRLPLKTVLGLVHILEIGGAWRQLMAIVPLSDTNPLKKYKVEHIKLIEQAGEKQRRLCSEIFLEEWGTSGKRRPDLSLLLQLLGEAQLFRAADYVTSLMKVPPLQRPTSGPAASIDVSEKTIEKLVAQMPQEISAVSNDNEINGEIAEVALCDGPLSNNGDVSSVVKVMSERCRIFFPGTCDHAAGAESVVPNVRLSQQETLPIDKLEPSNNLHLETKVPHMQYSDLKHYTDNFNDLPLTNGGRKLGTGAFGSVFLAVLPSQKLVAVKRLHRDIINVEKQFQNEVESLSRFKHTNILSLMGYSCDNSTYCLIYEYMSHGSLQDRLACKDERLLWKIRLDIILGTAHGILFLHTAFEKPLIHRDIKSANILLDQQFVPKLGDFGLVHLGQQGNSTTLTTTVFGTSAYMAPEAFRGDVSVKLDTFSFGVVLLEILTGLPPHDAEREGFDLVTHIESISEEVNVNDLLDSHAGDWGRGHHEAYPVADGLFAIAFNCIEDNKQRRPIMSTVAKNLEDIIKSVI